MVELIIKKVALFWKKATKYILFHFTWALVPNRSPHVQSTASTTPLHFPR